MSGFVESGGRFTSNPVAAFDRIWCPLSFESRREDGAKEFRPLFWGLLEGRKGWHWKAPPAPRPLYNLSVVAQRPDAIVLVTEGEKAADAATAHFPNMVTVTPMNGALSPAKTDWSPLAGRHIVVWGDHDHPGREFGNAVSALCHSAGASSVRSVQLPDTFPEKWDLADAPPPGWTTERLQVLIEQARPWSPMQVADQSASAHVTQDNFRFVRHPSDSGRAGVYYEHQDQKGVVEWRWFCSLLEVLADTRDDNGENWGRLLRITDRDGRTHEWAMPMAMLAGDGAAYREFLLSLGMELAPGINARRALHEYISIWQPDKKIRCVERIGWHGSSFVLPDTTYGGDQGERVLLQTASVAPSFALSGSIEEWEEQIALLALGNSRLAFAISAAFAGPLLHLTGEESGGFHFNGGSSIGKTTLVCAGGSVWGARLDSWRTTDNAAEGLARDASDCLLCLDEIGQADGKVVDALSYMLSNERGKARMKRDASNRRPISWRVLFLSTGEVSLMTKLQEGGKRARAGQEVRVVEIPADAGVGLGVFEDLHGFADGDELARHLKQAAEQNTGHASRLFLEKITENADRTKEFIDATRQRWLARYVPSQAHGQIRRVAGRFALVAAAGELASMLDVLPWEAGEASKAAARCFDDWLDGRGGSEPAELREGMRQVRLFLEQHGSSRFETFETTDSHDRAPSNRAGFRRKVADAWEYLVLPQVWRSEICQGFDHKTMARHMIDRGWMMRGEDKNLAKKERIPGVGQVRVYRITSEFLEADFGHDGARTGDELS